MRHGGVGGIGEGVGGSRGAGVRWGGVVRQLFPISTQSGGHNPPQRIRGATQRSESQRYAWAKILPIRRSSQFVLPYPRCLSGVSGPLSVVHKIRNQR